MKVNKKTHVIDLGIKSYAEAWAYQKKLFQETIERKVSNRNSRIFLPTSNYILIVTHPHVYTLGKSGKIEHLLLNHNRLSELGIEFFKIDRGGDITYHGPGQLVVYPILDLENFFTDINKYLRSLEQSVIDTLTSFNIHAGRISKLTGVWVGKEKYKPRKICAMGVKASRWVTMHGLALNINVDLGFFKHIVPCGIFGKEVTSMHEELDQRVNQVKVQSILINNLADYFDMDLMKKDHFQH